MADPTSPDPSNVESENDGADETVADEQQPEPTFVDLYAGLALDADEALAVTLRYPAHLVVFAGGEGSGKTTILATIYENLVQGPFAGFRFAGSRSLSGFEQICHHNRIASGNAKPETARTHASETRTFYHLALAREDEASGATHRHILLAAVSGERFRLARDSAEDCAMLSFIPRADVVVVLVDGEKLAGQQTRENALADAAGILDSFVDDGVLGCSTRVEIAFSKHDCIEADGRVAEEFLQKAEKRLRSRFSSRLPDLSFRKIAARPEVAPAECDKGFLDAFNSWIATSPESSSSLAPDAWESVGEREFSDFRRRYELVQRRVENG